MGWDGMEWGIGAFDSAGWIGLDRDVIPPGTVSVLTYVCFFFFFD